MENKGSGVASASGGSMSPQEAREMWGTLANCAARVTDFAMRSSRCSSVAERWGSEVVLEASAAEDTAMRRIAGQIERSDLKNVLPKNMVLHSTLWGVIRHVFSKRKCRTNPERK
jgi:hypothetical protein